MASKPRSHFLHQCPPEKASSKGDAFLWLHTKREALEHINRFSHDSLLVKSADILSNASELLDDVARDGQEVFSRFNAPKEKIVQHYLRSIAAIIQGWEGSPLVDDLRSLTNELQIL